MVENKEVKGDAFGGVGCRVTITVADDFLKVKETLTRVGIVTEANKLQQICYILHKKGQYAIVHHKELLCLDGVKVEVNHIDISRRNTVANLLQQWNLVKIIDSVVPVEMHMHGLKVVPYKDKTSWHLFSTYNIGRK